MSCAGSSRTTHTIKFNVGESIKLSSMANKVLEQAERYDRCDATHYDVSHSGKGGVHNSAAFSYGRGLKDGQA